MIIRFKIQAFVALLTVSILVAVAAQIPLKDVFTVVATAWAAPWARSRC